MSATEFRRGGCIEWRKNLQAEGKMYQQGRKNREASADDGSYTGVREAHKPRRTPVEVTCEVVEMPERHVAYIRHVGPYNKVGQAFDRLAGATGVGAAQVVGRGVRLPRWKTGDGLDHCQSVPLIRLLTSSRSKCSGSNVPAHARISSCILWSGSSRISSTRL